MLQKIEDTKLEFIRDKAEYALFKDKLLEEGHLRLSIDESIFNFPIKGVEQMNELITHLKSEELPYGFKCGKVVYWRFKKKFYKDTDGLKADEVAALLITRDKLRQQHIHRAKTIASLVVEPEKLRRGAIPDDLKLLVWERDHGQCTKCGSSIDIQFDHVIPFSFGGATTPENLQILCGKCNRLKSASVI